ncbi:MAG TPA: pantoate--beta-alanine ligase, partial [Longimicrobiales bacterium]
MQTETTRQGLRRALAAARAQGRRICFVPTMGYLHEGHLALVDRARQHGDVVVMSIFVNALQFGPQEDLARYPRDLARDSELAAQRGVHFLFAPADEEIYPHGRPAVTVLPGEIADRLCGHFRPGHFEGVLTVVAKLFNIVEPAAAVFGQKDFQQCVLVKRMCADLDFPVEIVIAPTVREADGLALSSRNTYLDEAERKSALLLSRGLRAAQQRYREGARDPDELIAT